MAEKKLCRLKRREPQEYSMPVIIVPAHMRGKHLRYLQKPDDLRKLLYG